MKVEEVVGIGPADSNSLSAAGAPTTEELLTKGATSAGRTALAEATGISHKLILTWVNHADLMRINGVGPEYSELLEAAGVDSPAELAHRNPTNLEATFQEVAAARPTMVRRVPSLAEITDWIEQSKSLPKVVEHGGSHAEPEHYAPAEHDHAAHEGQDHAEGHDHEGHDHAAHDHAGHDHPHDEAVHDAPTAASAPAPAAPAPAPVAATPPPAPAASTPPPPPAPAPAAAPTPPPARAAAAPAPAATPKGLWARIKSMFGG
jgi:predicted flap endonuclease-1-like 5' DNA nuclease